MGGRGGGEQEGGGRGPGQEETERRRGRRDERVVVVLQAGVEEGRHEGLLEERTGAQLQARERGRGRGCTARRFEVEEPGRQQHRALQQKIFHIKTWAYYACWSKLRRDVDKKLYSI